MADAPSPAEALRAMLDIERIDTDLFRGVSPSGTKGRVFGGQVVAQALAAASAELDGDAADGRRAHSLHAYFLRAGDNARPIIYRVLRDFDGGSFSHRRVVAMQGGKPILNLAASFQRPESGFEHSTPIRDVPPPEECAELTEILARNHTRMPQEILQRLRPFEIRASTPEARDGKPVRRFLWFRLTDAMNAGETFSRVLLAYFSDFALITTAIAPHAEPFAANMLVASIDHALWIHAKPDLESWLLYDMETPWAGQARGFARGTFHDRSGRLIASAAQEGVCRMLD